MKNKTITIVCSILAGLALICVLYIVINTIAKNNVEKPNVDDEPEQTETQPTVSREERGQNVNVNSRIGVEMKKQINYSQIYSDSIVDELDNSKISSKAKLLIGLDKIYRIPEYNAYMQYSEETNSTYILSDDMQKILDETFVNTTLDVKEVDNILSYDPATNVYVVQARGFAPAGVLKYTLEVPYKITQYSDRIELLAYRVYITKNVEMIDIETKVVNTLFADKDRTKELLSIEGEEEFNDNVALDYIRNKVDEKIIDSNSLEEVEYIFKQQDGKYLIDSFEKIDK